MNAYQNRQNERARWRRLVRRLRALGRRQLERDMFDLQLYGPGSVGGHGVSHVAGRVRLSRAQRLHRAAIRAWHRVLTAQAIRRYGEPF